MRVAFAGTPEFAAQALAALRAAGHEIVLVLTQPDRPAGRGMKLQPSPVKQLARQAGLAVVEPRSLRLDGRWPDEAKAAAQALQAAQPRVMVVAAYGLILPAWVLGLPPLGCLNIHASLLPRWRGAAPIERAIEAGDAQTGVTIMQMDEGLDTGPVLTRHAIAIHADDDTGQLHDRLASLGARAVVEAVHLISQGKAVPQPQSSTGITYAHKITRHDQELDWRRPCMELERRVRALRPAPGARAFLDGELIKFWAASCVDGEGEPGTVLDATAQGIVVACGEGALRATLLQRAGGTRVEAVEFLRGHSLSRGDRFDIPAR